MGDRVLMQCFSSKSKEVGPVVYGHWCGSRGKEIVSNLAKRMKGREGDLSYSSARLVQETCGDDDGNLSVGMWNADKLLTADDSHGDAGVILIDVDNDHRPTFLGGYLADA